MLNTTNNDLEIDLTEVAFDRTHRIGDPKKKRQKALPIIARFVRYYDRKEVFSKKKNLKGRVISITESLTSFRMKKVEETRQKYNFKHVKGIQAISKRIKIFEYLKYYVNSNGFTFLQETHSSVKYEKICSNEF